MLSIGMLYVFCCKNAMQHPQNYSTATGDSLPATTAATSYGCGVAHSYHGCGIQDHAAWSTLL